MRFHRLASWAVILGLALVTGGSSHGATLSIYTDQDPISCDKSWSHDGRESHCEVREQRLSAAGGSLAVNAGMNGGISVTGWDGDGILVRTRVQASAETLAQAEALVAQIQIEISGNSIRPVGPQVGKAEEASWSTTFQIFVPRNFDLSLTTFNGGIAIGDVTGTIKFEALNGGVALRRVGGDVRGNTTNGGLAIALDGSSWNGSALDVYTVNGGVSLRLPGDYSAQLEVGTVHGGVSVDVPGVVLSRDEKSFSKSIGAGGPLVRVRTTNGGLSIKAT